MPRVRPTALKRRKRWPLRRREGKQTRYRRHIAGSGNDGGILYDSQDKTRQDVGCIFRSGNAEWREAMQRIVDRNDAKPGRKRRPQMLCFGLRRVLLYPGCTPAWSGSPALPLNGSRRGRSGRTASHPRISLSGRFQPAHGFARRSCEFMGHAIFLILCQRMSGRHALAPERSSACTHSQGKQNEM